jgi:electron transfer flavoprotein-quinone oxidoreductase
MGSGQAAARAAIAARHGADGVAGAHRHYRGLLEGGFVLQDHKRLRRAPQVVFSDFVQRVQPGIVCDVAEAFFTVENPAPKPGLVRTVRRVLRSRGVRLGAAARSALATARLFR